MKKRITTLSMVWSLLALVLAAASFIMILNTVPASSNHQETGGEILDYINIYNFGAVGDGVADDTEAFKKAMTEAEKTGYPVYVPNGTFLVTDTIKIKSTTLYGHISGSWTADDNRLPTIIMTNHEAPLFEVASGSVAGFKIDCKLPGQLTYAEPAFLITTAGGQVKNVKINYPFVGIKTDDQNTNRYNPGRCVIENVFITFPYRMGVYVGGTYDVPTLNNIEVWNPDDHSNNSIAFADLGTGFYFAKNDDLRATNLFIFNAKYGFVIDGDQKLGGFWGSLTNCSADYCHTGLVVLKDIDTSDSHLTLTGGTFWGHQSSVVIEEGSKSYVSLSGCEFRSNGASTIRVEGGDSLSMAGCVVSRVFEGYDKVPAMTISGGNSIAVSGNVFNASSNGLVITDTAKGGIAVTGNVFKTTKDAVVNGYKGSVSPVIANNVFQELLFDK